jgi:small GTP-binding protein
MVGLDAAGKTTILFRLIRNEVVTTIPTIGFNVEVVKYKGINFTVWDVGGQDKIRRLWKHYYENTNALIFVIDSNDTDRLELAYRELGDLLNQPELKDAVVLVLANKQDLHRAASLSQIALGVSQRCTKHTFKVQRCSATLGEGLDEGLSWLAEKLRPLQPKPWYQFW